MTPNNNLSPLPWYSSIELQNHRKDYAYGQIYPLYSAADRLLPFQILREPRTEKLQGEEVSMLEYVDGYLNFDGNWVEKNGLGCGASEYDVTGLTEVYLVNCPAPYRLIEADAVMAAVFNSDELQIGTFTPITSGTYTGVWKLPANAASIRVQTYNTMEYEGNGNAYTVDVVPTRVKSVKLFSKDGLFVKDLIDELNNSGLQIATLEDVDRDVIVYPGLYAMTSSMLNGQYYAELSDGVETWYSEIFTVVQDTSNLLKVEWYDIENFVFDAGAIVYRNPSYKNVLYLCTELGKPDYEFEEEGEDRDGYFFAEKQVSSKIYKCTITAPEYLCDVMRFIRMADYVRVTDQYGRSYDCDTFLITPKWQTQGDVASVEIEFTTSTAVKKIGRGYTFKGDFNEDFNNDYSK